MSTSPQPEPHRVGSRARLIPLLAVLILGITIGYVIGGTQPSQSKRIAPSPLFEGPVKINSMAGFPAPQEPSGMWTPYLLTTPNGQTKVGDPNRPVPGDESEHLIFSYGHNPDTGPQLIIHTSRPRIKQAGP